MARPLWVAAGAALLGITGGAGILIASSGGEEEAAVQQAGTATGEASVQACDSKASAQNGAKLWRWGSAVVEVPEGLRAVGQSKQGGPASVLELYPEEDPDHGITVDADTAVISKVEDDDPVAERESELQAAAFSAKVCSFDRNIAPWPYSGGQPDSERETVGKVTYLPPNPASGIQVLGGTACSSGCRDFVEVRSARSVMFVDAETGLVMEPAKIAEDEKEAFDRYFSTVEVESR